ncbi:uncharacterized protein LOC688924 isoform X1 [Rattus norvegicus]|uniref:uncharacterized protein LOC688924 isoform X1 n=1 Tax=Rattus norvegicus TaxID=10116 RepID=UPI0019178FEE|nr:uncharacterized protein LOC688924 isoform X1 [Rattus norvegicus]
MVPYPWLGMASSVFCASFDLAGPLFLFIFFSFLLVGLSPDACKAVPLSHTSRPSLGLLTKLLRLPFNTFGSPAKDYLCLSVTSFCFCILLAIPALLFSLKTREANSVGDWRRAQRNSRLALGFSISSIIVGCLLMASSISLVFETEDMTSS